MQSYSSTGHDKSCKRGISVSHFINAKVRSYVDDQLFIYELFFCREFCGTFKGLLRKELEDNYHVMASEFGPGMFQRMKVGIVIANFS
jgi:hypothetical protein